MAPSFATSLDALGGWRMALARGVDQLARFLEAHELAEATTFDDLSALQERLRNEKLVVAFVAEFSRGKSELINAIFFADTGRRVLPATPGRTTMCPVELGWDGNGPAVLKLLPIQTRLEAAALTDLRAQSGLWHSVLLDVADPQHLARSLEEVTRTTTVPVEQARALGFWDDAAPDDNPPVDAQGQVEVPAWRHALINYPHPLLRQGLVVLDTPGLNAIGAEPELTLSLLPSAHATVFILGADTGVTRSDLTIWRDHLSAQAPTRFVVLNKIDALVDPLATSEQVQAQILSQQAETARTLEIASERVFPVSARQALAARIGNDPAGLRTSRLPALEHALGDELLPRRRAVLEGVIVDATQRVEGQVSRHLGDRRRQLAEQMLELRGLRGRNGAKVRLMLQRVDGETAEFEQCTTTLQAMRSVHGRLLRELLLDLSSDRLRDEVGTMQRDMSTSLLHLGAKKAFMDLCERLRALLGTAAQRDAEIRDMLSASFGRLNAEYGFSLALAKGPDLERPRQELSDIESSYVQYLGLTLALRLAQPKFMEQFRRMLISKLRVVFENVSSDIELWNKTTSAQVDSQLRERRRAFKRRRETLERIQVAAGDLEARLSELESQDRRLVQYRERVREIVEALCRHAGSSSVQADDFELAQDGTEPARPGLTPLDIEMGFDTAVLPVLQDAAGRRLQLDNTVDIPLFDDEPPMAAAADIPLFDEPADSPRAHA